MTARAPSQQSQASTTGRADDSAPRVEFSGHLHYIADDIVRTPFLSERACDDVVRFAEEHAAAHGGWTQDDPEVYSQTTTDLEVDRIPPLRAWLAKVGFIPALQTCCTQVFGTQITAMDDAFIVCYQADAQKSLELHTDAGDISFMVALSHPTSDYAGGGTFFEELGEVVSLKKGQMILFNAKLFHSGIPITAGRRYLLVGFCYTAPAAATEPGNVALDFTLIPPPAP